MNNAKVMVTKEVAEALEGALAKFGGKGDLLETHARTKIEVGVNWHSYLFSGTNAPLDALSTDEMAKVLYIGYTVEKSPEEKVAEYLAEAEDFRADATDGNYYEFCNGRIVGIKQTLAILGIKIEGVNAK